MTNEAIRTLFPVGARVLCESEMYQGKWERGEVVGHLETRYGVSWALSVRLDSEDVRLDGALVDYDYRFLDSNPHNSLVRREAL